LPRTQTLSRSVMGKIVKSVQEIHGEILRVTPRDIVDYKLPTQPLRDVDVKRAKDALKNDPFLEGSKEWAKALEQPLEMGVRQHPLAKCEVNFVMDASLPAKLKHPEKFLP
jgi:DNA topoisomerase-6 subunit A